LYHLDLCYIFQLFILNSCVGHTENLRQPYLGVSQSYLIDDK